MPLNAVHRTGMTLRQTRYDNMKTLQCSGWARWHSTTTYKALLLVENWICIWTLLFTVSPDAELSFCQFLIMAAKAKYSCLVHIFFMLSPPIDWPLWSRFFHLQAHLVLLSAVSSAASGAACSLCGFLADQKRCTGSPGWAFPLLWDNFADVHENQVKFAHHAVDVAWSWPAFCWMPFMWPDITLCNNG